ncbi:LuxR C-terminal-related transcriptional regulator [Paenibacillus silvisoli]|uniref:LuxR C-terminal-related transcriptional regulator n=1 Tax=Paenibacillus silvisoli TaxID=3110539 RepID=UPI002804CAC7|nr:LuxR C-terminal-related transcriptional regulator [Paenibacillus silvisoli]
MNRPILTTKLYIPFARSKVVLRQRLIDRINEGLDRRKLTLISASAGFGKTTLASEWAASCDRPVAWLSLDEGDNEAASFLAHFIAALKTIANEVGDDAVRILDSQQSTSVEAIFTSLLNDISALPCKLALVLDDYHTINAKGINDGLIFLVEHLPPHMHVVIATREDPQLPLSRLRARGLLTELRAADLRFSVGQAAEFFSGVMGLKLSADDIAALESRTEGWIAGLQLAALSLQRHENIPAFLREFAGDNRYIVDYLVEEVLRRQPEPIRNFLLQTSILDRLCGPLCDAVTGQENGSVRLEALEKGNFFVVPLDDKRHWYRYHHLFAQVLYAHVQADQPDRLADLHRRASVWYEQQGSSAQAIHHALAAKAFARAADLIELAWPSLRRNNQGRAALGWLRTLPDELVRCRPVLSVAYAWASMASGQFAAVEARLRDAERLLETQPKNAEMVVVDQEEYRYLPSTIAGYRAAYSQVLGDTPAAIRYARQVLDLVPEGDHLRRGAASALLGLAAWTDGSLETAHRLFSDGMAGVLLAGNIADAVGGTVALADIRISQGRLLQAMRTCERGIQLAADHGKHLFQGTAAIYAIMSELCCERNELQAAMRHLQRSKELSERAGRPKAGYRWHVAMARLTEANGDPEGALAYLEEAERLYASDFFPNVRPVAAMKTRAWIAQGKLENALDWAREQGLSVEDEPSYLREFEQLTLARVLLAKYRREGSERMIVEAAGLLERLLKAAEEGERLGSTVEILILQAIVRFAPDRDIAAALSPLERALELAGTEGFVRLFVDEGPAMASLLEAASKQGIAPHDVQRLLTALGSCETNRATAIINAALSEPLSQREHEVLRLFRTELSGPDIARELHVSLNTLRTHTKHIFGKLEVNNRRAAVRRAEELGLF